MRFRFLSLVFFNVSQMTYSITFLIFWWILQAVTTAIYLPVRLIRWFKTPKKCPPITNKILLLSATDLAEKIRKQEISSETIIQAYILRINEVNPIINALIENRFPDALQEAKRADNFVRNSGLTKEQIREKYPLLGVPITIKGSIALVGMMHSAGSPNHTSKATVDATAVKYVKNSGAIPLLMSNVPELCMNWETSNKLVGTTSNPYNTTRTPGGSSGGEASLLGCGASVIGLGSDVGGSLRLPAHYCGVWGHKPSPYVVSTEGHYPDCRNKAEWKEMFTMGPITRYASDLKLLLNIIAEPDVRDVLNLNQKIDLRKIKVYYMMDANSLLLERLSDDVVDAINKVIKHFDDLCTQKCTKVQIPLMKYSAELTYLKILLLDVDVDDLFQGKTNEIYYELLRFLVGTSSHELSSLFAGLIRRHIHLIPEKVMKNMGRIIRKMRRNFLEILVDDAVIIVPTYPKEATHHNDVFRKPFNYGYCSIFNILGFPATNCPISFSKNGLPIGIQVVAAPNLDRLTLTVAEELERVFGGWKFN